MPAKEIKELRQSGQLEQALAMAQNELDAAPENIWGKRNISWVYYEYLKRYAQEINFEGFIENLLKIKDLNLPEGEVMIFDTSAYQVGSMLFKIQNSEPVDYSKINRIFEIIKDFHFTKPAESYSLLYKAFHKGYKNWGRYLEFSDWWNFENFRPEDYQKEEYNGRQIMALVEQAYIAYSKKLLEGEESEEKQYERIINKEKIHGFTPHLDKIIEEYPQYQYPPYFKAKLLLALGDNEDILAAFLPFAKKKKNDFWVWELMSDVFPVDDERKTACLCKALSLRTQEDFLINTRQKLAEILIKKELFDEAKTEINKIIATRESHSWKVPQNILKWTNEPWFNDAIEKPNNKDYYDNFIQEAEKLLFNDIEEEIVVVEFVNKDKKILNFIKDKTHHGFFSYKNLKIRPKIGDFLKIRLQKKVNDGPSRVYTAKVLDSSEQVESEAIKLFSGQINIPAGKNFGFLEDIFVSPDFIEKHTIVNRQELSGKAILSFNKKKNDWGWKCYDLL